MNENSSVGKQLYEQKKKGRFRLIRTGIVLQLAGFFLPIIIGLLFGIQLFLSPDNTNFENMMFAIIMLLSGVSISAGSFMVSELREPKLPNNKYRPSQQFHSAYRRKGQAPILIGVLYFFYGLLQLIHIIRG